MIFSFYYFSIPETFNIDLSLSFVLLTIFFFEKFKRNAYLYFGALQTLWYEMPSYVEPVHLLLENRGVFYNKGNQISKIMTKWKKTYIYI